MGDFLGAIKGVVGTVAPVLATALGGPLAGTAVQAIAQALGLTDDATEAQVAQTLQKATPEQLLAIKQADQAFAIRMRELGIEEQRLAGQETLAQIDVNKEEAKSASLFVSGGRPAVIWIGAAALAYQYIVAPFLNWLAASIVILFGGPTLPPLATGSEELIALVTALLGVSGMRSYDKMKGTARDRL